MIAYINGWTNIKPLNAATGWQHLNMILKCLIGRSQWMKSFLYLINLRMNLKIVSEILKQKAGSMH